jgi:hypothetical protein
MFNETTTVSPDLNVGPAVIPDTDQADPFAEAGLDPSLANLFTTDLTNVDLERPLLKPGKIALAIKGIPVVEDNKNEDGKNLIFKFTNRFDCLSDKGKQIKAGRVVIQHYISLKPTDKNGEPRQERILEDLAKIKVAVGFPKAGPFGALSAYADKPLNAMVIIEEDTTGKYGPQNRISKFEPATA